MDFFNIVDIYHSYYKSMQAKSAYDFIDYGMTRKSFNIPQQMIDWKNQQDEVHNNTKKENQNSIRAEYGFIDHILAMAEKGKTREEIARYLKNNGFPRTVIGALTAKKWAIVGDKALMKWAENLCQSEPDK